MTECTASRTTRHVSEPTHQLRLKHDLAIRTRVYIESLIADLFFFAAIIVDQRIEESKRFVIKPACVGGDGAQPANDARPAQ